MEIVAKTVKTLKLFRCITHDIFSKTRVAPKSDVTLSVDLGVEGWEGKLLSRL